MQKSLRIGQILYTNTLPVYFHFDQSRFEDRIAFLRQVPAQLNEAMARGDIDVGPISSFSYAEHASEYLALADLSVSAKGRVGSIFLFSKKPIEELDGARIALTNTSATSVNLLKIILHKFYGHQVSYVTQAPVLSEMMQESDGALLIGDDAIMAIRQRVPYMIYDLGELWHRFTGYSMTFALWAVRKAVLAEHAELLGEVHASFLASKKMYQRNPEPLIDYVHMHYGGEKADWRQYFRGLQHSFDDEQRAGLEYFYRCAAEQGLLPRPVSVEVWENPDSKNYVERK
ncbi:menaquinone biosynthesis protein [Brevibacillus composti]|uniref:Chorismate dehydratase n=1 Tax=Brevibacillus composti TaxID=2796470 RepID=A0A7T5EHK9_9BACL|nr:menaquinone biosynthesis protein [Brevibacillus composti]QQE72759.1 menaquinone biosynthesis protein [Brevibacillus composti]QUO39837.1 menaquinone biosynthesis protein [Brevibacillus composti]